MPIALSATVGCGSDADSSEPAGADPAEKFAAYARGEAAEVPWADHVTYTVGGEEVARFDAASADRPQAWAGCPVGMGDYEGRDCPVSPLTTIAHAVHRDEGIIYETSAPAAVGCNRYRAAPGGGPTTWIRPGEDRRDCFSDFAVAVSFDESARISSIDLTLSGP